VVSQFNAGSLIFRGCARKKRKFIEFPIEFAQSYLHYSICSIMEGVEERIERISSSTCARACVCMYIHLSGNSCRRERIFNHSSIQSNSQSRARRFLPSRRTPETHLLSALPSVFPVFFFFSLPLFPVVSEALLGTSLRFSRA